MNTCHKALGSIGWIKRLLWAYFFLLIFEGALRKWVLPSAANALVIARDPLVILIYLIALNARLFPGNVFMTCLVVIALSSLAVGLAVEQDTPLVALYGFQADFLHLPLIFLIPKVFTRADVRRIGFWTLLLSVPLAILMAAQFEAPFTSWLNAGAGADASQIGSALGHVRPAATFSFVTGAIAFFVTAAAFLVDSQFSGRSYPRWLVLSSALSLPLAVVTSGSRGFLVELGLVLIFTIVTSLVLQPRLRARCVQMVVLMALVGLVVNQFTVFQEGTQVFDARIRNASGAEGGSQGFVSRGTNELTHAFTILPDLPLLGVGLGVGTNGGSALLTGKRSFLLAEGEWDRILWESGPILGTALLLYRICLALWLCLVAARAARRGNTLPILLFSSCVTGIVNGDLGQPSALGFLVLGSGLSLAALRMPKSAPSVGRAPRLDDAPSRPIPGGHVLDRRVHGSR